MRGVWIKVKIHIVQKGETIWDIATKYGVDFEEVKELNHQISSPDMIMPGMKLKIPTSTKPVKNESEKIKEEKKEVQKENKIKETKKESNNKPKESYKDMSPKPIQTIKEDDVEKPKEVKTKVPHIPITESEEKKKEYSEIKMPIEPTVKIPTLQTETSTNKMEPELKETKIKEKKMKETQQNMHKVPMETQHIPVPHYILIPCCHMMHHQQHPIQGQMLMHQQAHSPMKYHQCGCTSHRNLQEQWGRVPAPMMPVPVPQSISPPPSQFENHRLQSQLNIPEYNYPTLPSYPVVKKADDNQ